MTKHILICVTASLALWAMACKNNASPDAKAPDITYPYEKPDSLLGFEGCMVAGYRALSPTEREFIYQDYSIKIADKENAPGENIEIVLDSIGKTLSVPASTEEGYFQGMARGHFFVDIGTAPDVREIVLYTVTEGKLMQAYRTNYLPAEPPFISANGGFWFYTPIAESDMLQVPDCPDKEKWVKDGLRVGYGQRCVYNLVNRMLTKKSEYVCVPLQ